MGHSASLFRSTYYRLLVLNSNIVKISECLMELY